MSIDVGKMASDGNALLKEFVNKMGLSGAVIASAEGLEIASYFKDAEDKTDLIAANAASLLSVASELLEVLEKGSMNSLIGESDEGYFSIKDLGSDVVLVVSTPKGFKMGGLVIALKQFVNELIAY